MSDCACTEQRDELAELRDEVAVLRDVVNALDREAEGMERRIVFLERAAKDFRAAIYHLYRSLWKDDVLGKNDGHNLTAFYYRSMYPEKVDLGDGVFTWRAPYAVGSGLRSKRRWRLYSSVADLQDLAKQHGLRKKRDKESLVRMLEDAGVEVPRRDAIPEPVATR